MMNQRNQLLGFVLIFSSALCFGSIPVFASSLGAHGVSVWVQIGARLSVSIVIFAVVVSVFMRQLSLVPRRTDLFFVVANGFFLFAAFAFYLLSIALGTPPTKAVLIAYLSPILATTLSWLFLKEQLTPARIAALALGTVGVALTLEFWTITGLDQFSAGDLCALGAAFAAASITVLGRWGSHRRQVPPIMITLWSFTAALLWMAVLGVGVALLRGPEAVIDQLRFEIAPTTLILLVALAVIGTTIPYLLMYMGLSRVATGIAVIYGLPEVLSVFVLSAIFLQQGIGEAQLVGGAVILGAGVLAASRAA